MLLGVLCYYFVHHHGYINCHLSSVMLWLFSPLINILMVFKFPAAWIYTCSFIQDSSSDVCPPSCLDQVLTDPEEYLLITVSGCVWFSLTETPLSRHPSAPMHLQPISTAVDISVYDFPFLLTHYHPLRNNDRQRTYAMLNYHNYSSPCPCCCVLSSFQGSCRWQWYAHRRQPLHLSPDPFPSVSTCEVRV